MRRRDFLLTLAALSLSMPVLAQEPERIWRVGVLSPTRAAIDTIRQVILPELAKFGFVEGRNLELHSLSADGAWERLSALGREIVQAKPDVIIAVAPASIRAARAETNTIPIVMSFAGEDPVAAGWVQSYARPGGNVTGIVMLSPEMDGKRLDVLLDAFPALRRIGVLFHARSVNSPNELAIRAAARRIGVEVMPFKAGGQEEYGAAFDAMRSAGVAAVLLASSPVFRGDAARLAELALQSGLPTICEWQDMVEKGCLISYGPKLTDLFGRVGVYVARIMRGTSPSELPVEEPTSFQLTVNLKTAKALNLDLPVSLLARADEVIE